MLHEDGAYILTRRLPAQFDVSAQTHLVGGSIRILASQIRQDLWRGLKTLRGFSPVVRIEQCKGGLLVTAGGQVAQKRFARAEIETQIATLLSDPAKRARWIRHSNRKGDRVA